jgi:hypothetical protein
VISFTLATTSGRSNGVFVGVCRLLRQVLAHDQKPTHFADAVVNDIVPVNIVTDSLPMKCFRACSDDE